jgi:predicted nucleic acid-binding protein
MHYLDTCKVDQAISTLALDLVMFFAEKDKIDLKPVRTFLDKFTWLPITEADAHWAFANYLDKDFEDGLQVACALREGCDTFVTLDQKLAKKYTDKIKIELIR